MHISRKRIIIAAVLFTVLALVAFGMIRSSLRWQESNYFGVVSEVTADHIVVRGPEDIETAFLVTEHTEFWRGRQESPVGVQAGERVIVVSARNPAGQLEAELIRVVRDEPRRR